VALLIINSSLIKSSRERLKEFATLIWIDAGTRIFDRDYKTYLIIVDTRLCAN